MNGEYKGYAARIEARLEALCEYKGVPEPLAGAMRYSMLSGGKRLRGVLLLAATALLDGSQEAAIIPACAVEMIHCYSLIHDDLPAMDDDDLRRGKPTNHKVYGDGMAILAGDGLLTEAFEAMLSNALSYPENISGHLRAIHAIARGAGVTGMVAGQCLDLEPERDRGIERAALLDQIQLKKTAALITAPIVAGLHLAGATQAQIAAGEEYGRTVGLCFQVVDDLLDVEGDAQSLGKQTGMDAVRGKLTWPGLHGVDAAHAHARQLSAAAVEALAPFGEKASFLQGLAKELCARSY